MNIFNSITTKTCFFSTFILNIILFVVLLICPIHIIHSIRGGIVIIIVLAFLLLLIIKHFFIIAHTGGHTSSSDKEDLFYQNSELMNRVLGFKDREVSNLQTEISIKDSLYKQLFDFAPDAFVIFTVDSISYFNDAFADLVGVTADTDLLSESILTFIHPDSMARVKKLYHKLLVGATDFSTHTLKVLTLNNTIKEVHVSSSIAFFQDTYYLFSCAHDLSDHNEQERIKLELENNVEKEKLKVECFANISHDIKTPINVVYSAVQLQEMYTQAKDYDKVLVYNNIIKQNCLRLQKLLNDVLDITKFDANHFKANFEDCNIIPHMEHITQSITSFIEQNDIAIIFDTNVEDKFTQTDLCFIERIMLNLISNAIKYGKENGHVWVNLHDTGNYLIISIKDDGIGIAKEQIPNIFKRFHKTNQTTAKGVSSNGIGLSLVKSMVETLGGTISCLSKEGVGSEFIVILPMESLENEADYYDNYTKPLALNSELKVELSDI